MSKHDEKEILGEEIKKEFQLERLIRFSDAVFAIVITLMAIEIRLPETGEHPGAEALVQAMDRLLPVIVSYCVSFVFIGVVWYQHPRTGVAPGLFYLPGDHPAMHCIPVRPVSLHTDRAPRPPGEYRSAATPRRASQTIGLSDRFFLNVYPDHPNLQPYPHS